MGSEHEARRRRARTLTLWLACLVAVLAACAPKVTDWGDFDVLTERAPRPRALLAGRVLEPEAYLAARRWGEAWFRESTFGNERTLTDVVGLFGGSIDVPCAGATGRCSTPVLPYLARALDALDGQPNNLYAGNGGGYTSDLVLVFPPGATLHGIPVPERVHTGLDVEAGSPWPLGVVTVPAPSSEAALPYLIDPSALGVGPAPSAKVRLGLTCATCHFSLDVDWDGSADLRSAWSNQPTPGSPYRPEHGWAIGNQDLRIGWVIALSSNPLAMFSVFSGAIGGKTGKDARAWARWVKENYARDSETVLREVIRGMLLQPRGFADDTPDGLFNAMQIPSLYTRHNWPYNYDGNFINAEDRNNGVWTVALDPTTLVSFCRDRAGTLAAWHVTPKSLYHEFRAEELAELMLWGSPAVRHDPSARARLKADILGEADGSPGMLDRRATLLVPGLPFSVPEGVRERAEREGRARRPASFGADSALRGSVLGYAGVRVRTPPEAVKTPEIAGFIGQYSLPVDELLSASVSLMLDSLDPPPNLSPLLSGARALVRRGQQVFTRAGCADCHRGPFFTDNLVHSLSEVETEPSRAEFGRTLQEFVAPSYDARTGRATSTFPFDLGSRRIGYKTVTLRYVWGSAPYLHDGGVGVGVRPGVETPKTLAALLALPAASKLDGMGPILALAERDPERHYRADAALSLQALVLESERARVVRANQAPVLEVPGCGRRVSAADLAIRGIGHEYFVKDVPGGPDVTALVAFMLALDDDTTTP